MRNRADQLAKNLLREALARLGTAETEVEVASTVQRIDVWCVPEPRRTGDRAELGLLGELASEPCMFEPFGSAPSVSDLLGCVRKQLSWHSELQRRSGLENEVPLPPLYVVSSGRPSSALDSLRCQPAAAGLYAGPPAFRLWIVVLPELPRSRETLVLRLLGAGRVLREALEDVMALPDDAWEKCATVPWLLHFGFELPGEPAAEEELSVDIQAWFKSYQEKVRGEGREEGIEKGREEGIEKGRELALSRLAVKRLSRPLTDREASTLTERLNRLGEDRVDDVLLALSGQALTEWLADPDAG